MNLFKEKKKGFTLVELLMIIALIGIMSAVILVALQSVKKKAKETAAKTAIASASQSGGMCYKNGGTITSYVPGTAICTGAVPSVNATWPELPKGGPNPNGTWTVTSLSEGRGSMVIELFDGEKYHCHFANCCRWVETAPNVWACDNNI